LGFGTLHSARENYMNAIYKPEEGVTRGQKVNGLPQKSFHGNEKWYDNPFMALAD
jgi:hypothetical protein